MSRQTEEERARRKIEQELDRQLEETFPASDPLKITRHPPGSTSPRKRPGDDGPEADRKEE
jgi:hypothetical protein